MSTEERVNNDDIFVPEFKAVLDTLDVSGKQALMKSIFYNPHAPQNENDPMTMAIILNVMGISEERYKICRKYGHVAGGFEYNNEERIFRSISDVKADVQTIFEKRQVSEPRTNSKAKTLPFTSDIKVYLDKLKEDSKNVEEPFKTGKYTEYLHFLRRIPEVFQIFKHNLSGEPDEVYFPM